MQFINQQKHGKRFYYRSRWKLVFFSIATLLVLESCLDPLPEDISNYYFEASVEVEGKNLQYKWTHNSKRLSATFNNETRQLFISAREVLFSGYSGEEIGIVLNNFSPITSYYYFSNRFSNESLPKASYAYYYIPSQDTIYSMGIEGSAIVTSSISEINQLESSSQNNASEDENTKYDNYIEGMFSFRGKSKENEKNQKSPNPIFRITNGKFKVQLPK